METIQLATRIDSNKKKVLDRLHKKTRISIRHLTEKAITLLDEYYRNLQKSYKEGSVDSNFIGLLNYSMKKFEKTYRNLAK